LASPLSCHCRKLSQALPFLKWGHYFCALRNASSFNHFMYSVLPEFIHTLLKVNSQMLLCFVRLFYIFITSISVVLGTKQVFCTENDIPCPWWFLLVPINNKDWQPTAYFFLCCLTLKMKLLHTFRNWEL
jgi:hypothetical protein